MSGPCFLARFLGDMGHAAKATLKSAGKAARGRIRLLKDVRIVRSSRFFDGDWYLRNNPDVAASGMDPAVHYLKFGAKQGRNPSKDFVGDEYLALHPDVRHCGLNPLLHYETFGRREGRAVSLLEVGEPVFPDGAAEAEWRFGLAPCKHRRTVVFAAYFDKGVVPETTLLYLRGLKQVADNIVFIADCPVFPQEREKLEGIVAYAKCARHGEYDFGSYKRGYAVASDLGLLASDRTEELVFCNDSCYAPIFPFEECFGAMQSRSCDFWGMTPYYSTGSIHIQSFFYVFRQSTIASGAVGEFLANVRHCSNRGVVVVHYELAFTRHLVDLGYSYATYLPSGKIAGNPMKHPLRSIRDFRLPLLKVKALRGDSLDPLDKVVAVVRKNNPDLARLLPPPAKVGDIPFGVALNKESPLCKKVE